MRAEITVPSLTRLPLDLVDEADMTGFQSGENLVIDLSNSSLRAEIKSATGGPVEKQ